MRKKSVLITSIILICLSILFILTLQIDKSFSVAAKNEIKVGTIDNLPNFNFKELNSNDFSSQDVDESKSLIVVLFNTTCEYCHDKIKKFIEHSSEFKDSQILFISSESAEEISAFRKQYEPEQSLNIRFLHGAFENVNNVFVSQSIPAIWIYNRNKKLVKKIDDIVPIKIIIKYTRAANAQ